MENSKAMEVFRTAPVPRAVLQNALPAMAAMLMVLIYNLADTFSSARLIRIFWWRRCPWPRRCS